MAEALQERLRRLRRAPEALPELEQDLLGESAPLLPLKERLERLIAVASLRARPVTTGPSLEELAPGRPVQNERGEFYLSEMTLPLDHLHGDVALSRLRTADP